MAWGNLLEVSNLGGVRATDGRAVTQRITRYGYAEVHVQDGGKTMRERVHRLVAKCFVPGYFDGAVVDHLDCDKLNNRADNLEWVTVSENTRRQHAKGILQQSGEMNPNAKLTDLQTHAIRILYQHNFPPALLGEWFGVSASSAYQIGKDGTPALPLRSRRSPSIGGTKRQPALFSQTSSPRSSCTEGAQS